MSEIIKVEHEDELITATRPAFYVMGVGHGHAKDGDKITTYTMNVNDRFLDDYQRAFAEYISNVDSIGEKVKAIEGEMCRLLIGSNVSRKAYAVTKSGLGNVFMVVHKRPGGRR